MPDIFFRPNPARLILATNYGLPVEVYDTRRYWAVGTTLSLQEFKTLKDFILYTELHHDDTTDSNRALYYQRLYVNGVYLGGVGIEIWQEMRDNGVSDSFHDKLREGDVVEYFPKDGGWTLEHIASYLHYYEDIVKPDVVFPPPSSLKELAEALF
jgi:hypothetical protein